jgi:hypothetical protein
MATDSLNQTPPAAGENRERTESPNPSAATPATATAAKPAKSPPARRKKAAAKPRPRATAKASKAPATRRSASRPSPSKPKPSAPAAPAAGFGDTLADLVERSVRPYASAQEQIASAARGTWIAPVAQLNARVITKVASAQADLARRLLG